MVLSHRQLLVIVASLFALPPTMVLAAPAAGSASLGFSTNAEKCIVEVSIVGGELYQRIDYQVFGDGRVTRAATTLNGHRSQSATPGAYLEQNDFAELKTEIVESGLYGYSEAAMQKRLADAGRKPIRISGAPWAQVAIRLERAEEKAGAITNTEQEFKFEMIGAGAPANLSSDIPAEYAAAAKLFRVLAEVGRELEQEASQ